MLDYQCTMKLWRILLQFEVYFTFEPSKFSKLRPSPNLYFAKLWIWFPHCLTLLFLETCRFSNHSSYSTCIMCELFLCDHMTACWSVIVLHGFSWRMVRNIWIYFRDTSSFVTPYYMVEPVFSTYSQDTAFYNWCLWCGLPVINDVVKKVAKQV